MTPGPSIEEIERAAYDSLHQAQLRREERAARRIRTFYALLCIILLLSVMFGILIINAGPNA